MNDINKLKPDKSIISKVQSDNLRDVYETAISITYKNEIIFIQEIAIPKLPNISYWFIYRTWEKPKELITIHSNQNEIYDILDKCIKLKVLKQNKDFSNQLSLELDMMP